MKISVVVINYNNGQYLNTSIDSILNQSRLPDQIVISDDGSTDNSLQIIHDYIKKHQFIKLVQTKGRIGPGPNRHYAINTSSCDVFVSLDSDDWLYPTLIESIEACYLRDSNSIYTSDFCVAKDEVNQHFIVQTNSFCKSESTTKIFLMASRHRSIPGNQIAMSKKLYDKVGGIDCSLKTYEDWELLFRATLQGINFVHTGIVGFGYRKSGNGISSVEKKWKLKISLILIAIKMVKDFGPRFNLIKGFIFLFVGKSLKKFCGMNSAIGYN